jgi:sugar phosphate isomerase/epimerase
MIKIGVSSYSLSKFIRQEGNDLFAAIDKAAELGFEGIEFVDLSAYGAGEDEAGFARRVRSACEQAGLPIVCYTVGADFLNPRGGGQTLADEVQRVRGQVRIAAELGVTCMRHDATCGFPEKHTGDKDFPAALPLLADACREVTELGAELGVRTTVENHGFFVQDSERCEALIQAVGHENFGSLVDMGNFLCADEDPVAAVRRMAPYAFHTHAKDFHVKSGQGADPGQGWFRSRGGNYLRGSVIGHGDVDVPACLRIIKDAGYDGFLSIEFEGMEDCVLGLQVGLENLRRYLGD